LADIDSCQDLINKLAWLFTSQVINFDDL
jgi:hypothetical protein